MMAIFLACGVAFAQQGEKAASVNLGYGSGSFHKAFKVGAEFKYNVTDAIRIAPGFEYFMKQHGIGLWSASVNGHYLFDIRSVEWLKVYPLVGLTLLGSTGAGGDAPDSDDFHDLVPDGYEDMFDDLYDQTLEAADAEGGNSTKVGANLGAGIQYPILPNVDLGFEIRYQFVSDFDQVVFGINAAYKF